jgi:UDP-glucuronate decarboxylase
MNDKPDRKPQRILVTGAAGFLGSHLCERLLEAGHHVVAIDNLSSGSHDNVQHLLRHPRLQFHRADVMAPASPDLAVDAIYNLACPASPPSYQLDPIGTTLTSVLGTWQMLELAQRCRARLLQASTSEIYGDPQVHPQPEDYHGDVNTIGPRACYDEGKRCAETLCCDYRRQYGLSVRIARIFNTYGPRMLPDDGRVVSNFIMQALRDADITLHGDGTQTRCFCYVDDTIEGLVRLMDSDTDQPVNLGNPGEITMAELAGTVLRLTGSRSRLVMRPLPEDDPRRRCPDITRASRLLGWQPRIELEDGLQRTIAYFRELAARSGRLRDRNAELPPQLAWFSAARFARRA